MIDVSKPVSVKDLRPHWVCHFDYWDGPSTGLVEIDGQHYWATRDGRWPRRYTLTPIVLTEECMEFLGDYQQAYHHAFYTNGQSERYDGRSLAGVASKWGVRNPIRELAESSRCD